MAHKNKENYSPYKARMEARKNAKSGKTTQTQETQSLRGKHKKPDQIYSAHEANDRMADIFKIMILSALTKNVQNSHIFMSF